jgi:hypothetical protein
MKLALVLSMMLALSVGGAIWAAKWLRRRRRLGRLESAETEVAAALDDGRLARQTAEALLQHLEGLRRECRSGDEA